MDEECKLWWGLFIAPSQMPSFFDVWILHPSPNHFLKSRLPSSSISHSFLLFISFASFHLNSFSFSFSGLKSSIHLILYLCSLFVWTEKYDDEDDDDDDGGDDDDDDDDDVCMVQENIFTARCSRVFPNFERRNGFSLAGKNA